MAVTRDSQEGNIMKARCTFEYCTNDAVWHVKDGRGDCEQHHKRPIYGTTATEHCYDCDK